MNKEIIKEFDEWFAKTMADCAMYEFPEKGIEGLLEGKTGKFSGFCFLKQYVQKRINFEIKKALQVQSQEAEKYLHKALAEARDELNEVWEGKLEAQNQDLLERLKKAENGWRAWIDFAEYIAKDAAEKKKKTNQDLLKKIEERINILMRNPSQEDDMAIKELEDIKKLI